MRFLSSLCLCLLIGVTSNAQVFHAGDPNWVGPSPQINAPYATNNPTSQQIKYTFTVPANVSTSAGVYDASGTLIRTLWRGRYYGVASTITDVWDGEDDAGNAVSAGNYQIKVLHNGVTYTWDGTLGNTTNSHISLSSWDKLAGSFPVGLAFVNGTGYTADGYSEQALMSVAFKENDPNTPFYLNNGLYNLTGAVTIIDCVTDGNIIYYAAQDSGAPSFVFGMYPSGQFFSFATGFTINGFWRAGVPQTVADISPATGSGSATTQPTGVAVQRSGNILAVSHTTDNVVNLFDKLTGISLGTISISNPIKMAFDLSGNLWVCNGGSSLIKVTNVGSTNNQATVSTNLVAPISVSVSPVTGHLWVADGGTSQQVKEFDVSAFTLVSTIGVLGGYTDCNPAVTNTRLFLTGYNDAALQIGPAFVSVDDAGDVWIKDGNSRILHFRSNGTYVNRIMYRSWDYQATVNHSSPTRVFDFMYEYAVNYSVPMLPGDPDPALGGNGSWELVKNWGACNNLAALKYVEDFSNGQTYAITYTGLFGGAFNFAMLRPGTAGLLPNPGANPLAAFGYLPLLPDGSVTRATAAGSNWTILKKVVSGYDVNTFPIYSADSQIASFTGLAANGDPVPLGTGAGSDQDHPQFIATTGGVLPTFYGAPMTGNSVEYHLGGVPTNGSAFSFKTHTEANLLFPDGIGSFPSTSQFGGHNGIQVHAWGRNIISGYDGQYATFSSQWMHWWEDGLFVGQFGFRGSWLPFQGTDTRLPPNPGQSGNIENFIVVQAGSDLYVYVTDESIHKGVHRFHISNLNSIHEVGATGALGSSLTLTTIF